MVRQALVILAAVSLASVGKQATARPALHPSAPVTTKALLAAWAKQNEACRGGFGSDPNTDRACKAREATGRQLESLGWCYEEISAPTPYYDWRYCSAPPSPAAQTAPPLNDTIHLDISAAMKNAIIQRYEEATDECMRARAATLLTMGQRSRRKIATNLKARCGATFYRILIEQGGFSEDEADGAVDVTAYRALNSVLDEAGTAVPRQKAAGERPPLER